MNNIRPIFAALLLLSGCVATQEMEAPHQVLVKVSSLPAYSTQVSFADLHTRVAFRVLGDGTIAEVHVLESAADQKWNAMAVEMMKQWRFSAATGGTEPDGRWIQYALVIHTEDQVMMTLGEIVTSSKEEADSLYNLLDNEVPFASIAKQFTGASPEDRATFLGKVDIATYPQYVRDELRPLRLNHFTRPIRLGNSYVIYFRFEGERFKSLVQ